MFDGFWLSEPSSMDEAADYIEQIQAIDPDWPLPNYDVEDLAFLNTSFVLVVSDATEDEVRSEIEFFREDGARGHLRLS
jgi:hypothetical protein